MELDPNVLLTTLCISIPLSVAVFFIGRALGFGCPYDIETR